MEKKIKTRQEDLIRLESAKELLLSIKEEYKLTFDELKNLLEEELSFPIEIFNNKLTVLESIVKYLKEERNLSLRKIANILNKDERNIWHIYDKSKKKYPKKFIIKKAKMLPISILSDTKLSPLESIVYNLKDKYSLSYHEIAQYLQRDDRTIWTVYQRARKKGIAK